MRFPQLLTALVLVLAVAACSGDSGAGPGPGGGGADGGGGGQSQGNVDTTPDPCRLVAKDEATKAVGVAVADGLSELVSSPRLPTGRSCRYAATAGRGLLMVTIWPGGSDTYATLKQQSQGEVQDVAGIGDAAFRNGWTGLTMLKGEHSMSFSVELAKYDPDTAQTNLKALANTSIGRL